MTGRLAVGPSTAENSPPDRELARRAASGDGDAFLVLLRRHDDRLRALAARLLVGLPHHIDDAMQSPTSRRSARFRASATMRPSLPGSTASRTTRASTRLGALHAVRNRWIQGRGSTRLRHKVRRRMRPRPTRRFALWRRSRSSNVSRSCFSTVRGSMYRRRPVSSAYRLAPSRLGPRGDGRNCVDLSERTDDEHDQDRSDRHSSCASDSGT